MNWKNCFLLYKNLLHWINALTHEHSILLYARNTAAFILSEDSDQWKVPKLFRFRKGRKFLD